MSIERIQFCYRGQAPSKSNYRYSHSREARAQWKRIAAFRDSVGFKALEAWQAAGGKGSMLRHSMGKRCEIEIAAVNQRVDAVNLTKDIPDALEGICFVNDKEVAATARPVTDDGDAYVQITVKWLSGQ